MFGLLEGFLAAKASGSVPVFCAFDNEEVGSQTKQGAASSLLSDTLRRIALALGLNEEGYLRMLAQSFLVSADNAHGVHPNHPEYADMTNTPRLNGGVVIKFNANQRYTTDGRARAGLREPLRYAGRLDPRLHRHNEGLRSKRRHRPCTAGHALLRGNGRRGGSRRAG